MLQTRSPQELLYTVLAMQLGLISLDDAQQALTSSATESGSEPNVREALLASQRLTPVQDELVAKLTDAYLALNHGDVERSLVLLEQTPAGQQILGRPSSKHDEPTVHFDGGSKTTPRSSSTPIDVSVSATTAGERFLPLKLHAAGGLGEVLIARDMQLRRDVALKQLQDQFADDPSKRQRFILEGEVTGALEHPGIVPVHALGADAQGRPFYAMRFIRGETLRRAASLWHAPDSQAKTSLRDSISYRRLLSRFVGVCQAIEYAHSRGVVHRDIKPANIMLGKFGETYVVDWGMALLLDSAPEEASRQGSEEMLYSGSLQGSSDTQFGSILGTPAYMSPEQAAGNSHLVGPASDVYSLGATLYYLLTGKAPFDVANENPLSLIRKVAAGEFPAPRQVNSSTPRELDAVCLKAMRRLPQDRYASPLALATDIERWMADEPVSACAETRLERAARWSRKHRNWVVAGGLSLALVAVVSTIATLAVNRARERQAALAQANRLLAAEEAEARQLADDRFLRARETVDTWLTGYSEALQSVPAPGVQAVRSRMLELAADEYETFVDFAAQDDALRLEQGRTLIRLGSIYRALGRTDESRAKLDAARETLESLSVSPDVAEAALISASLADGLAAQLAGDRGDVDQADAQFTKGAARLESLLKTHPASPALLSASLTLATNRGGLLAQAGDFAAAEQAFDGARQIGAKLLRVAPNELGHSEAMAVAEIGAGQVKLVNGNAQEAADAFEASARLFQAALEIRGTNDQLRQLLVTAHLHLAAAKRRLGDVAGERAAYASAIQLATTLADAQPEIPAYQVSLAMAQTDLGQLEVEQFNASASEAGLRAATARLLQTVQRYPHIAEYQETLAASLDNLAQSLLALGRFDESIACTDEACRLLRELMNATPGAPTLLERAATAESTAGQAHYLAHRPVEARQRFETSVNWLKQLDAIDMSPLHRQQLVAAVHTRFGDSLFESDPEAAAAEYSIAAVAWNGVTSASPDPELAIAAAWFWATSRDESQRDFVRAAKLAQAAAAGAPANPRHAFVLAVAQALAGESETALNSVGREPLQSSSFAPALGFIRAIAQQETDVAAAEASWSSAAAWLDRELPGNWDLLTLKRLSAPADVAESSPTDRDPAPASVDAPR